jgi:hypothetical protein
MIITITKLHTLLAKQLGADTAENLTTYIEEKIKEEFESSTKEIATKDFVRSEIANSKTEMIKWFVGVGLTTFIALSVMIIGLYFKN